MNNRYASLAEFRTLRTQARNERDLLRARLADRWTIIQDPRTRGALLRDAMGDVLRSWKPYRKVQDLLHGRVSGSTVAAVGMAVASAQHGMGRRLLFSGISMLLGKAIGDREQGGPGLLSTVATAVGRGVQFMRERKAARQERQEEDAASVDRS